MKQYLSEIRFKIVQEGKQNRPEAEAGNGIVGVYRANCTVQGPLGHETGQA